VLLGLIFPAYITRLEFKTKEELQQMPQTEDDHKTGKDGLNDTPAINGTENNDATKTNEPDVEVSMSKLKRG